MSSLPTSFDQVTHTDYTQTGRHTHTHTIPHTAGKSNCALSIFPESSVLQGVSTGFKSSRVVSSEVLAPQCSNGHLVEVAELEEELHRRGVATRYCCVVSNTPVLPLGVCRNTNHMTLSSQHTARKRRAHHFNKEDGFIVELKSPELMAAISRRQHFSHYMFEALVLYRPHIIKTWQIRDITCAMSVNFTFVSLSITHL